MKKIAEHGRFLNLSLFLLFLIILSGSVYALTLDIGTTFNDGYYNYTVNTQFNVTEINVTDGELYIDGIAFCDYGNIFVDDGLELGYMTTSTTVRIDESGYTYIRRIGVNLSSTPTYGVQIYTSGSVSNPEAGYAGAWYTPSDERFKTNKEEVQDGIDKVLLMEPIYYDWLETITDNETGEISAGGLQNGSEDIGFVAQALNTSVSGTAVLDEDNMVSNSDTQLATQQSIKAYVDGQVGGGAFSTTDSVTSNAPGSLAVDDFVFGSDQLDDDGNPDHDSRIFFDKSNGAFRAGRVTGTQWDNSVSGTASFASGYNTKASGSFSTAMGNNTEASGNASTAMGDGTVASGEYSTAMGQQTTASGPHSTSMGAYTEASGSYSTAMGGYTEASGSYSTAMGYYSTAQPYASVALGRYNVISGNTLSWAGSDPVFIIGNGASAGSPANAFVVQKNGVVSGTFGTYHQASDARLKENITQLPDALDKVIQLRGVTFNWKEGDDRNMKYGLIAQEVEEVLPEMVHTNEKGYKAIEWWQLNGVYVEAIKELKDQNEALTVQNEAQQSAISALQKQLAELELKVNNGLVSSK